MRADVKRQHVDVAATTGGFKRIYIPIGFPFDCTVHLLVGKDGMHIRVDYNVLSESRSTTAQLVCSPGGKNYTSFFIVVGVLCM